MASVRTRRIGLLALLVVLIAGLVAGTIVLTNRSKVTVAAQNPDAFFQTATLTKGDLTATERVDGAVVAAASFAVIHRIDAPATTTPSPVASPSPAQTASPAARTPQPTTPPRSTNPTQPANSPRPANAPQTTMPKTIPTTIPTTRRVVSPTTASPAPTGGGGQGGTRGGRAADRATETITSIISVNTVLQSGDALYSVDGHPVIALDGELPVWRSLSISSKDGADIKQLEASLVALGFDPNSRVKVDEHFDAATQSMVKAWQTGLGLTATGSVPVGSIVFVPMKSSVTTVSKLVGSKVGDGDSVLTLTAATQNVVIDVPAGDQAQVVPGLKVKIGQVDGEVKQLRSAIMGGTAVVQAVLTPSEPLASVSAGSTVKVTFTVVMATNVLLVPASALVSRLDGTYAVQVGTTYASAAWKSVKLLGVSGGTAAIEGDSLDASTKVLVPA